MRTLRRYLSLQAVDGTGGEGEASPRYQELCLECASCWEICEREATDFSYPRGGTGVVIEYG